MDSSVGPPRSIAPAAGRRLLSARLISSIQPVTGPGANPSATESGVCRSVTGEVRPQKIVARIAVAVAPQFDVQLPKPGRWSRIKVRS